MEIKLRINIHVMFFVLLLMVLISLHYLLNDITSNNSFIVITFIYVLFEIMAKVVGYKLESEKKYMIGLMLIFLFISSLSVLEKIINNPGDTYDIGLIYIVQLIFSLYLLYISKNVRVYDDYPNIIMEIKVLPNIGFLRKEITYFSQFTPEKIYKQLIGENVQDKIKRKVRLSREDEIVISENNERDDVTENKLVEENKQNNQDNESKLDVRKNKINEIVPINDIVDNEKNNTETIEENVQVDESELDNNFS